MFVGATDGPSAQAAIDKINAIANPQLPTVGERFLGTVVKTTDFGAFVSLLPGRDGLVHISKLGKGKRIAKVEDVVNVGDKLRVEIADIDKRGKISRSWSCRRRRAVRGTAAATGIPRATAAGHPCGGAAAAQLLLPGGCEWSPNSRPAVHSAPVSAGRRRIVRRARHCAGRRKF